MPSLQSLNLGCSFIYTSSLEALLHVTKLVKLELADCENLTTAGLVVLQQLGSLSHLDISSGMMLNQCELCLHSLCLQGLSDFFSVVHGQKPCCLLNANSSVSACRPLRPAA